MFWKHYRALGVAVALSWLLVGLAVLLTGCAPFNIDVNGYRAPAAKPGQPIHCKGACP